MFSYGVGEVYCLYDFVGKDGVLYKNCEELKVMVGKGVYIFVIDLIDDYFDVWWFFDLNVIIFE